LAEAMSVTGNPIALQLVSYGGLLATASVLLTAILGVSRMAFSMARRGDMPLVLSKLHNSYCTPYYSIWATGIMMAAFVFFFDLTGVVAVSTFGALFYYALTNVAALRLKIKKRRYPKLISIIGLVTCVVLLAFVLSVATQAWIMGIIFLMAGTIYYGLKRKHLKRDQKKVNRN
jgi:APA family basic amino acid/polyamine antiporter